MEKSCVENSVCSHAGLWLEPAVEVRGLGYPQCWDSAVSEMRARLNWS